MRYDPYVPQSVGEVLDYIGYLVLSSPTFKDETGYLPQRNVDTAFFSLNEGLLVVRKTLGEECYATLRSMSDKMRALFESDSDDINGDAQAGRELVYEMEEILIEVAKREASK